MAISHDKTYILTIEGIGEVTNGDGQLKICTVVPDYAKSDNEYVAGLAAIPRPAGGTWDIENASASIGSWSFSLKPDVGPVPWFLTRPTPSTSAAEDIAVAETDITMLTDNAPASVPFLWYCERETVRVTGYVSGTKVATVARGYAGSTDVVHNHAGSDTDPVYASFFATPPKMTGRLVRIFEVDRVGSAVGNETKILQGYIAGEVSSDLHWPTWPVQERFGTAKLNPKPTEIGIYFDIFVEGESTNSLILNTGGYFGAPTFNTGGAYFWMPDIGALILGTYSDPSWTLQFPPIFGSIPEFEGTLVQRAFEVAFADITGVSGTNNFSPFGFTPDGGSFTPSNHPIDIVLNLMVSTTAGTNKTASSTSWDRGTLLATDFALGIPIAQIDAAAFASAKLELTGVNATEYFVGNEEPVTFDDEWRRLLGVWGYVVTTQLDGTWTILHLGDQYPDDTTTALTASNMTRAEAWRTSTTGKSIRQVVLQTDPDPDGETHGTVTIPISEVDDFYPAGNGVVVGGDETWDPVAIKASSMLGGTEPAYQHIVNRARRLVTGFDIRDVVATPALWNTMNRGDGVTLKHNAVRDPTTGLAMTSSSTALKGWVAEVRPDLETRETRVKVYLSGTVGNVALHAPSGRVASYDNVNHIVTLDAAQFDAVSDSAEFTVGDVVVLLDSRYVLRSDNGATYPTFIIDIDENSSHELTTSQTSGGASGDFRDSGGNDIEPADGNIITYALYDELTSAQSTKFASGAKTDATSGIAELGAADDAPYVFGD